ncbi:sulfotransferase family 2 domain-containing protein [Yoonia algicola]|uniref:Sulfotransferase family 2 domain-containing protein n=1 Tax=Yoonia algicola TaxID=3137368 RepID=A0AAN0M0P0_9RHOB
MVLVCHKKQLVYLKTNKTAGTSVEMFLQSTLSGRKVTEKQHSSNDGDLIVGHRLLSKKEQTQDDMTWYPHMTAEKVCAALGNDKFESYLKVACVRNPYDLVISRFHWNNTRLGISHKADDHAKVRASFEKFLVGEEFTNSAEVVFLSGRFVPDVLIRFENLAADLQTLCNRLSIAFAPQHLPLTKNTKPQRGEMRVADYYTDKTCDLVQEKFEWLFQYANYETAMPVSS